ncbi:uncharacterized protein LOC142219706 [Haematobia irritans]|uniref:uncharacterized protein LOC142219706 n=1 Tax=Haematobia irritans TaxID=7368 RepID=UPI003F4F92EB
MIPQRFIQSYKCECFQPNNYCNCPYKAIAVDVLKENVRDVAETLAEVMKICNIPAIKAKLCIDVIIYYFFHFEEIIEKIDTIPRKRLSKEGLFHDLNRKCDMQRMEAQMAYSIIKRAFQAFYHGTAEGGVPNPWLSYKLIHTPECRWIHAAKRTAQIYAAYEGLFMYTQKSIENQIKDLYKALYERMRSRPSPDENHECECRSCSTRLKRECLRVVRVTMGMHKVSDPYEEMYRKIVNDMLKERDSYEIREFKDDLSEKNLPKCTCPTLKASESDITYDKISKDCNTGYSQGPFDCRWFGISKEEYEADFQEPVIELPKEVSGSPCPEMNEDEDVSSCETECNCECESCSCRGEDDLASAEVDGEGDTDVEDDAEPSFNIEQSEETLLKTDVDLNSMEST